MLSRTAEVIAKAKDSAASRMAAASPETNLAALITSLNFDAVDTIAAGLAGILAILMEERVDRERLADGDYREQAIEEALRLATPAVLTVRQAQEEVTIPGCFIPKDAMVWMWWSAGNRDPEVFDDPDRFRTGRSTRGLPFGIGAHSCVGPGWTKQLAHILIEHALTRPEGLREIAPGIRWAIGGARRPKDKLVIWR